MQFVGSSDSTHAPRFYQLDPKKIIPLSLEGQFDAQQVWHLLFCRWAVAVSHIHTRRWALFADSLFISSRKIGCSPSIKGQLSFTPEPSRAKRKYALLPKQANNESPFKCCFHSSGLRFYDQGMFYMLRFADDDDKKPRKASAQFTVPLPQHWYPEEPDAFILK